MTQIEGGDGVGGGGVGRRQGGQVHIGDLGWPGKRHVGVERWSSFNLRHQS